jgi:phytoene desaturase
MRKNETVAVIGGGVAGLAAGGFLARQGFQVKLFEANDKLGGSCATTTAGGYTFNDGALYLALPGLLDHVFRRLDLGRAALLPLRRISPVQTTLLAGGSTVVIGDGPALSVQRENGMADAALIERELRQALAKWEPVLRLFTGDLLLHPFSYGRLLRRAWRHLPKLRGNVASELRALFSDEAVRAALAGALLFSGASPDQTPVLSLLGLMAMLTEGLYLPEGGMGQIPETLSQGIRKHGGEIHLNAPVRRILLNNGRVTALETVRQERVGVAAVISTVSGMLTWERLLAPEDVPAAMRRRVKKAPLSHRVLSLQLGLANKIEVSSHANFLLPPMEEQEQVFVYDEAGVKWPIFFVPTVTMPELAPAGGSIVEMYPPIPQHVPPDGWDVERSDRVVARALDALTSRYEIDIAEMRVLTPRDFQNQMHLYQGAVYGLSPTAGPQVQFAHETPVGGLFQAGQTTYPGYGVSAAAMSGILAAEALIRRSRLPD